MNSEAPGDLNIGDYVFASRWGDCDWNDPWSVGFVSFIGKNYVEVSNEDGSLIDGVGTRGWRFAMRITAEQGQAIIPLYTESQGLPYDDEVLVRVLPLC